MIRILILQIALLQIVAANADYGNKEIIKMMKEYFKSDRNAPELIGYSFYAKENHNTFQVEILTRQDIVNTAMLFSFKAISKLTTIAKTKFTDLIVVIHFTTRTLPVVAQAKLECCKRFFIEREKTEEEWISNCLIINNY